MSTSGSWVEIISRFNTNDVSYVVKLVGFLLCLPGANASNK
jgi:hypothetical protein